MKRNFGEFIWVEVRWQRPYELTTLHELLTLLASLSPRGAIVWEVRSHKGRIRYFLGAATEYLKKIKAVFTTHGNVQFSEVENSERKEVDLAKQVKISHNILSLNTDITTAVTRSGLSAFLQTRADETMVLQIIFGASHTPAPMPQKLSDPTASLFRVAIGDVAPASAESRASVKEKISCHGFSVVIRVGSTGTKTTAPANIYNLLSALKTTESAGVRITADTENPERLNTAHIPFSFKLKLSIKELSNFLLLPIGDVELPGADSIHPKTTLPPAWLQSKKDRVFAVSSDSKTNLSISPQDSLEHCHIIGPTGSGKSTAMQNLILADINAGRSVLVLDPKADLVHDILARIPENRVNDVIVIDPSDPSPAGFNPLAFKNSHNPNLIADAILAVFQEVFKENWGIRSQDVLSAALLTLVQTEGASLLWLPTLLTDEAFRKRITSKVTDKIGLEPYWTAFENMKDSERRQEIAPVLNKIRQFLLRPGLRNVLGQSNPKFDLNDLFNKPRIVLVPLNKGLIGSESARLLGSLIVGLTWTLALGRANQPSERRRLVSVYIDELQDYLSLPTDLSDALAQARGLGVGLTLAHQYREQLPPNIRAGVDTNARNKIVFGLSASDAKDMAAMAPELEAVDFMTLPRYHIYTSFQQNGQNTGWLSGQTFQPMPPIRLASNLKEKCMAEYGKPAEEIETEYLELLASTRAVQTEEPPDPEAIGRRKRT
jgi:hypothetical protein